MLRKTSTSVYTDNENRITIELPDNGRGDGVITLLPPHESPAGTPPARLVLSLGRIRSIALAWEAQTEIEQGGERFDIEQCRKDFNSQMEDVSALMAETMGGPGVKEDSDDKGDTES